MAGPQRLRIDGPDAFAAAFGVSRETVARLVTYERLLCQWQKAVNLVAPGTLPHIWLRHFADSAQLWRLMPADAQSLLDLGSGAGFPGLVLAIMRGDRPAPRVTLIESDLRKAAFLREVARQTATPVEILSTRIENPETHRKVGRVDVVTVRALAPLSRLLKLAVPFFGLSTVGLFLKGRGIEREISEARAAWQFELDLVPSMTDANGHVAVVRGVAAKTEG